ncbi:MAG: XdhC family protein, partial [Dehalococcoidales bacterium]|nr:XdhC family protein [Dehalococcoidales bacterium]
MVNEQEYLAKIICEYIEQNRPCVMVSIISQSGSAPRHEGSKMVVDGEGRIYGTIGGSLLEATAIKKARSAIAESRSFLMNFSLDSAGTDSAGMICGGQATVLLDYIAPLPENREFFLQLRDAFTGGRHSYLLTVYSNDEESVFSLKHSLITPDRKILGSALPEILVDAVKSRLHEVSGITLLTMEDLKVLVDPIRPARILYCLGAGHVAKPTA